MERDVQPGASSEAFRIEVSPNITQTVRIRGSFLHSAEIDPMIQFKGKCGWIAAESHILSCHIVGILVRMKVYNLIVTPLLAAP